MDQAINNWDGVMGWTGEVGPHFWNHNYYWYQTVAKRFRLIPWDLDQTLRAENVRPGMPPWFSLDVEPDKIYRPENRSPSRAPSCDPLLRALALHARTRRVAVVRELLDGPFAAENLDRLIETWSAQVRLAVAADPFLLGGWGPRRVWKWQRQVRSLKTEIDALRHALAQSIR